MNQNPEQLARDKIDEMLLASGWAVQAKESINFSESPGVAIREYNTDIGPADYVLFVNRLPVGIIEAKKTDEGVRLTVHEEQSYEYSVSKLKWFTNNNPLPFVYESTGAVTRFTNYRDPKPRSRPVFWFHQPQTLLNWYNQEETLRAQLQKFPPLPEVNLRQCQLNAIRKLENSFAQNRPKALIQMATGAGKTYTAITFIYRLLKFAHAKRILFLVDTKNLGEQAEREFMDYKPSDDKRTFTELYNVQRLKSSTIEATTHVCISTIQRMYCMLKGEDLDEKAEETSLNELFLNQSSKEVVYNASIPIEHFDFIVIDECHRSIYNLWKQVLDYYDAFLIGLTATPDKKTFGFFNENIVSEYSHEDAVADGVNVGYETYTIETTITKNGAKIEAKEFIDKRERLTRRKRWEQIDEEISYNAKDLDRDVVNPSQIRNVIRIFRDKLLTEIFPKRQEVPKTLVFAKTDSHADDIIQIIREEFDEGNEFCRKITYGEKDPKSILQSFRNDYYPRIAVTVDMIATGTDVKAIECLLFMRDVRSKNYFEQMKGRGTRVFSKDELQKRTPSALTAKTHFVIVDAVGVTKTVKTESRSMERKPTVSLNNLLHMVLMGNKEEDVILSLGNRLNRLEKEMTVTEKDQFKEFSGGKSVNQLIHDCWNAFNPDIIEEKAATLVQQNCTSEVQAHQQAHQQLINNVSDSLTGPLIDYIVKVRQVHDQVIDHINIDTVEFAGWDGAAKENAEALINDLKAYIEMHKDEITALSVFYNQPYNRRSVTYKMIADLLERLRQDKPVLAPLRIWQAYEKIESVNGQNPLTELTALVSLIRKICGIDPILTAHELTVNRNFREWVFKKQAGNLKFTQEQMEWLRMIKDFVASSVHIEKEDIENLSPFVDKGGLMKFYKLFGEEYETVIEELNENLVA